MKLVIDISEDDYRKVQDGRASVSMMRKVIRNGTPLPRHGRLIDADNMLERLHSENGLPRTRDEKYAWGVAVRLFENAPTVIEADKGESEVDQ